MRLEHDRSAASAIKDLILDRGLHPGDPMPTEAELREELGVSRSSIREAVRTLRALDILEVRHGTGTFVGGMSLRPFVETMVFRGVLNPGEAFEALRDVVEMRRGLDLALAPQVVEALSHGDTSGLSAAVDAMVAAAGRNESFLKHDRDFHLLLAEHLRNHLYGEMVAAFWDIHRTMSPRLGVASQRDLTDTAAAHVDMLTAARRGDLVAYRDAVRAHYAPVLRVLDQRRATVPTAS